MTTTTFEETTQRRLHVPKAVIGSKKQLSPAARKEIAELGGNRPGRFVAELAKAWVVIGLAVWAGIAADSWLVTLLAMLVIGSRQVVLGLLLHEQVHYLGLRGRWGDTLVNLFGVYPLLATTVENYSEVHLRHHAKFMTAEDPDFVRKAGEEWTFPASGWRVLRLFGSDLLGLNTYKLMKGKTPPDGGIRYPRRHPTAKWLRPVYFTVVAAAVTYLGWWTEVVLYWLIPVMTYAPAGVRWIAVMEHEYNHEGAAVEDVTPLVKQSWLERLLMPDLNFGLHVYHHQHASVSFSLLPKVHEIYKREGLVDESKVFTSSVDFLKYVCGWTGRKQTLVET